MNKYKLAIVTGTRAEYGLLKPLLEEIVNDPDLEPQLYVTGMHLSAEFGYTVEQIVEDGFPIQARVDVLLSGDSPAAIAKSMGLGLIGFADAFQQNQPDLLIILGDRFEIFAAAQAAMVARIPIAHIHGGELTEGLIDEAIRHALTKMSHVHFTSSIEYRNRVLQLGEHADRVFNVGALGVDNIKKIKVLGRKELEQQLGTRLKDKVILVTYHPVTLSTTGQSEAMSALLEALDTYRESTILFTMPNADTDGRGLMSMIHDFVAQEPESRKVYKSLGQLRYLSAVAHVDVMVGNSSSGLIEAPYLGCPTVNIGDRQKGRIRLASVIDCEPDAPSIIRAIDIAKSRDFREKIKGMPLLLGDGTAATQMKYHLKQILNEVSRPELLRKPFIDRGN